MSIRALTEEFPAELNMHLLSFLDPKNAIIAELVNTTIRDLVNNTTFWKGQIRKCLEPLQNDFIRKHSLLMYDLKTGGLQEAVSNLSEEVKSRLVVNFDSFNINENMSKFDDCSLEQLKKAAIQLYRLMNIAQFQYDEHQKILAEIKEQTSFNIEEGNFPSPIDPLKSGGFIRV